MTAYVRLPPQLRPRIRIASVAASVDRADYAHALLRSLFEHRSEDELRELVDETLSASPLTLPDPENVLSGLEPRAAAALRTRAASLDSAARKHYPAPEESVIASYATYVPADQDGVPAGTVVWVREGDRATVQFALPRVRVDLARAAVEQLSPSPPVMRPAPRIRVAEVTAREVVGDVVQLASSVSWALPPPWGAAATGALTLVQILLGATDEHEGPSPLEAVKTDLENYLAHEKLKGWASDFHDFADQLGRRTGRLTMTPDSLDAAGLSHIDDFKNFLTGAFGVDMVHHSCTGLLDDFRAATLKDVKDRLDLLAMGITLWMAGQKVLLQLRAAKAGNAHARGDDATFIDCTNSWISDYEVIQDEILGDEQAEGWAEQIADKINKLTDERLAKIGEVKRVTRRVFHMSTTSGGLPSGWWEEELGWTFVDAEESGDEFTHFVADTSTEGSCHEAATVTQHKDEVEKARANHVTKVTAELDKSLGTARKAIASWKASLAEFAEEMPPPAPKKAPAAVTKAGGPATPQGTGWVTGNRVQYAVQFKNEKGPSALGPWSAPVAIHNVAFATVAAFPQPQAGGAPSVHLVRKFGDADGRETRQRIIKIFPPPVPSSFDDTNADKVGDFSYPSTK